VVVVVVELATVVVGGGGGGGDGVLVVVSEGGAEAGTVVVAGGGAGALVAGAAVVLGVLDVVVVVVVVLVVVGGVLVVPVGVSPGVVAGARGTVTPVCGPGTGVRARASCVCTAAVGGAAGAPRRGLNGLAGGWITAARCGCGAGAVPTRRIGAAANTARAGGGSCRRRWCAAIGAATASPATTAIVAPVDSACVGETRTCVGGFVLPPSAARAVWGSALSVAHAATARLPA
jgi:hypothetical protein